MINKAPKSRKESGHNNGAVYSGQYHFKEQLYGLNTCITSNLLNADLPITCWFTY